MTGITTLVEECRAIVGRRHVLTSNRRTLPYRRGFRTAVGHASAVVRPGSLVEMWRVLQAVARTDAVMILQAANTGLTGGSNPDDRISRPTVIINTRRLRGIHLLDGARQIVCLAGETLHRLEQTLRPFNREPHSVIGSSCIGASVVGGICNNSGGALVRRGPAFTELAVYARIEDDGALVLVNELGIDLGDVPEEILARLEAGDFVATRASGRASDQDYQHHVRDLAAATPARFNADPRRLCAAAGSAGRVAVFAVRLDTFARAAGSRTFYLGTNDPDEFTALRRDLLHESRPLPISAEYLHRDAFNLADKYGRDMLWAVRLLGTDRLPMLFEAKARVDALGMMVGVRDLSERILQGISVLLPDPIPRRAREWNRRFEHQLILTVDEEGFDSTRSLLHMMFPTDTGDAFECTWRESERVVLHRFVTAGAAIRFAAVNRRTVSGILALDVALPRNSASWFGPLPDQLSNSVAGIVRYGHFLCHVFHRDYLVARGSDPVALKAKLLAELDAQGAEYPAEHNVGRQYRAKPALRKFYQQLDPNNRFNPGTGLTTTAERWAEGDSIVGETM